MQKDKIKKVSISFRTSEKVVKKVLERVVADGYGLKGKSKWISEAVERFLGMPEYWDLVDIASVQEDTSEYFNCTLPEPLLDKIEKALIEVRTHFPGMEGVRSNILRASISQRLIQ